MAQSSRIVGSDVFDMRSIEAAFNRFNQLVVIAKNNLSDLKKYIRETNVAFRTSDISTFNANIRQMTAAIQQLARSNSLLKAQMSQVNTQIRNQSTSLNQLSAANRRAGGGFSLTGAAGVLGQLTGITLGIQGLRQLGIEVYSTMKAFDAMNYTLKSVTTSQYEYARALEFTRSISELYGADLLTLTKKYTTFRASAKETGFTIKETEDIFRSFTAVSATLGKSSEEQSRIFLALEQMMSKGKVSSEELRRQLGEVLPGAFAIMAKSIGVTTAELDKMLREGKVATADVLPNFAKAVKEAYGVDISKEVDTLIANQNRLINAWKSLIDEIGGENTKKAISAIFDFFAGGIAGIESDLETLEYRIKKYGFFMGIGRAFLASFPFDPFGMEDDAAAKNREKLQKETDDALKASRAKFKEYMILAAELKQTPKPFEFFIPKKSELDEIESGYDKIEQFIKDLMKLKNKAVSDDKKTKSIFDPKSLLQEDISLKLFEKYIKDIKELFDLRDKAAGEGLKYQFDDLDNQLREQYGIIEADWNFFLRNFLQSGQELTDAQKNVLIGYLEKIKREVVEPLKFSFTDSLKNAIAQLEDKRTEAMLTGNTEATKKYTLSLEALEATLQQIDKGKGLEKITDEQFANMLKVLAELNPAIAEYISHLSVFANKGGKGAVGKFASLSNVFSPVNPEDEPTTPEKILEVISAARDFYSQIDSIEQQIFNNRMARLDEEQRRTDEYYSDKMKLAEGDSDLQDKIRIQQEEANNAIAKKRREEEAKNARFKKASSLASAIMNTAEGITSALTVKPTLLGLILAALVGAMGAAQVGVISAQPIPKYAKGTNYHGGGYAILGDGGKTELAFQPDGTTVLSGTTSELHQLQRGSRVIPDAKKYIEEEVVKSIIKLDTSHTSALVDRIAESVVKGFSTAKVNNRNNINVKVGIDHQLWLNQQIRGN